MNPTKEDILKGLEKFQGLQGNEVEQLEHFFHLAAQDPNFLNTLFFINMGEEHSEAVRYQALILMQKQVNPSWVKANSGVAPISDISLIKTRILDAIAFYEEEPRSRRLYEAILEYLIEWEFPQNWPELLPQIFGLLKE